VLVLLFEAAHWMVITGVSWGRGIKSSEAPLPLMILEIGGEVSFENKFKFAARNYLI